MSTFGAPVVYWFPLVSLLHLPLYPFPVSLCELTWRCIFCCGSLLPQAFISYVVLAAWRTKVQKLRTELAEGGKLRVAYRHSNPPTYLWTSNQVIPSFHDPFHPFLARGLAFCEARVAATSWGSEIPRFAGIREVQWSAINHNQPTGSPPFAFNV